MSRSLRAAERGAPRLVEVADGVHAYLQQGSWGFSNAGLVSDGKRSLLIDTLYDLPSTARMLAEMRRMVSAAATIETLVNTHANGDHCWGNQLLAGAEIISSRSAAEEMLELSPRLMLTLLRTASGLARLSPNARRLVGLLGRLGVPRIGPLSEAAEFVVACFGAFDFRGIRLTVPTRTFDDRLVLELGDQRIELIQVGPAHTKGDVLVYLPRQRVVFSGDILFIGSHPIIWQGPVHNWIAACDRLLALDVDVVVPGHGPITDKRGVETTKRYWQELVKHAERGFAAGLPADQVAEELFASGDAAWSEAHRLVVNVDTVYRELAHDHSLREPLSMFARMARLEQRVASR
jgi:glyoxylase-like metal-dependent hydrolase (beta-lactamase superfamily II)